MALVTAFVAIAPFGCGITADYSGLQGGTRDAAVDAATEASAHPSFCASLTKPVKLCSDFDEGAPLDTGWGATDGYGGQVVRVDTTAFSPPGSFFAAINPSGAPSSARLLQTVPTSSTHVRIELEMLAAPGDGTIELAVIHEVVSDGTTYGLFYQSVNHVLQVRLKTLKSDNTVFDKTWPIGAPPAGWTRVAIDMDVGAAGSFVVQHGGAIVASDTNLPTSTPSRTAMFVEVGVYSFAPTTAEARFDDVIVDWP